MTEDAEEIQRLKAENRWLREDVAVLKAAAAFLAGELDPPQPLMMGFTDTMRAGGHAVESICRVLREQGCQIAARTYRFLEEPVTTHRDTHPVRRGGGRCRAGSGLGTVTEDRLFQADPRRAQRASRAQLVGCAAR